MRRLIFVLCTFVCLQKASGLGCIPQICSSNAGNEIRACPDTDGTCGKYNGKRFDNRLVKGVDVLCTADSFVYAPFNGTIRYYAPFRDNGCFDSGFQVVGEGQWQGYIATVSFVEPLRTGGTVTQGERVARKVVARNCQASQTGDHGTYVLFELQRRGQVINPTSHLVGCMCTGQICESNSENNIIGAPFKTQPTFGKGFEISCPNMKRKMQPFQESRADSQPLPAPIIYSPIDGKRLGRFRIKDQRSNYDCDNDGVFVVGAGKWEHFTARIYNAQFLPSPGPGQHDFKQGTSIARRLDCSNASPSKDITSVFVEFRYKGQHVNITELVSGNNCKKPEL